MRTGIARPDGRTVLLKKGGNTQDIISAILDTVPDVREQTKGFARQFTPDKNGMYELWYWVRNNIKYEEDPLGVQWVREPARLWHDRVGDCKSFTLFIISVLENIGVDYRVRFSNTERPGKKVVNHVYPVAIINGKEVIVDAVFTRFNAEKSFYYAKEYTMSEIYRLSGIGDVEADNLENYLTSIQAATADIPDAILQDDITAMTLGEFARFQQAQQFEAQADVATSATDKTRYAAAAAAVRGGSLAGIGSLAPKDAQTIRQFMAATAGQDAPAFTAPVLALPDSINGLSDIADAIKNAWRKIINWLFKKAMPLAAPFFLYTFIKKNVGPKTDRKRARQQSALDWIQKAGKFDSAEAVKNAAQTGIIKTFGKNPQQLLNAAAKGEQIAGICAFLAAAVTAITFVIEIVKKIAALFKKSGPDVSKSDAADLDELSQEIVLATPKGGAPSASGSGNDNMLLYGALALGGLLILSK